MQNHNFIHCLYVCETGFSQSGENIDWRHMGTRCWWEYLDL